MNRRKKSVRDVTTISSCQILTTKIITLEFGSDMTVNCEIKIGETRVILNPLIATCDA